MPYGDHYLENLSNRLETFFHMNFWFLFRIVVVPIYIHSTLLKFGHEFHILLLVLRQMITDIRHFGKIFTLKIRTLISETVLVRPTKINADCSHRINFLLATSDLQTVNSSWSL